MVKPCWWFASVFFWGGHGVSSLGFGQLKNLPSSTVWQIVLYTTSKTNKLPVSNKLVGVNWDLSHHSSPLQLDIPNWPGWLEVFRHPKWLGLLGNWVVFPDIILFFVFVSLWLCRWLVLFLRILTSRFWWLLVCVCVCASTGRRNRTHAKTNVHVGLQNSSTVSEEFGEVVGLRFSSHQVDFAPKQPKNKNPYFVCVMYEWFHSMERVWRRIYVSENTMCN